MRRRVDEATLHIAHTVSPCMCTGMASGMYCGQLATRETFEANTWLESQFVCRGELLTRVIVSCSEVLSANPFTI